MNIRVGIKRKDPSVPIPRYMTSGSSGCDVTSGENLVLEPGGTATVGTGLFLEVPEGYECQIRPRSGLAAKHGITVLNSPGSIDSDYRGELKVILVNHGREPYSIVVNHRIAQMVFAPVVQATFIDSDELNVTDRGSRGLGSTGD